MWGVCQLLFGYGGLWLICAQAPSAQKIEYPVQSVAITERGGEAGFEYDYLSETQKRGDGDPLKFTSTSVQEYLLYRLNGYVYHPRLLDFRTRFKIGLLQQMVERTGGSDAFNETFDSQTVLKGYDLYFNFFKEHPLSLLLFANRDRQAILQVFTDRQVVESERMGAVLNWKKSPFPMDLSVSRSRVKEYGVESYSESTYDILEYAIRNQLGRRMYSELRYRYQDYSQDFRVRGNNLDLERETQLKTHDLSFLNTIYLNEARTSSLSSTLRSLRQSGNQQLESTQWQERLNLQHTPNFSTYYLAGLLINKFETQTVNTWRGEAGLDHELFRSLRSHLDVHGRWVDYDNTSEDEVGVTGRLNYRKQTPWGVLSAGYGRTLDRVTRSGRGGSQQVIDESVTLRLSVTAFLSRPAVVSSSIMVTDASGVVRLDEGFDYSLEQRGNLTGLRLNAGGRVSDGETVLVDYQVQVSNDINYLSDSQNAFVRYDWERFAEGLATYARWQELTPRGIDAEDDLSVLDFRDWLAGFSYPWRGVTWTEEYEEYRSNFSAYNQLSSRLEGYHRVSDRVRLGWHAGMLMIDYLDDFSQADESKVLFAGLSLDGPIRRDGYWHVEGEARKETGLIDETLLGLVGKLGWQWRRVHVEAGGRLEQRERFDSTRDRMQLFLQVSREFGRVR